MALAELAVRLATVHALRAALGATVRISDSQIDPVDVRTKAARDPQIAVYTDDAAFQGGDGRDLLGGDRSLQLALEIVVAQEVEIQGDDGGQVVSIPQTDEGLELALDLVEREALWALQGSNAPWSELWRSLIGKVLKGERQRGAGSKDGVRFAARRLLLTVDALHEPAFGADPAGSWRTFLDLIAATPDLQLLAGPLEAAFLGEALPDWRQVQAGVGLTRESARMIGVDPVLDDGDQAGAAVLDAITLDAGDELRVIEPEA